MSHASMILRPVLCALFAVLTLVTSLDGQTVAGENRLKAAYIWRFPHYFTWPQTALDGRNTVDICLARPHPFRSDLEDFVKGETLSGRPLVVTPRDTADGVTGCQVLVFAGPLDAAGLALLKQAASRPILTIGDSDRFLQSGGIVALHLFNNHIRFDVSVAHAQRAGLQVSSQLLRLAFTVHGGPM